MKHTGQNAAPGENVPHDSDAADSEASDRRYVPGADDRHMRDEDATSEQGSLAPDSPLAEKLHHKKESQGQLDIGTGGDAGRPGKEGITGKPIPPRGNM